MKFHFSKKPSAPSTEAGVRDSRSTGPSAPRRAKRVHVPSGRKKTPSTRPSAAAQSLMMVPSDKVYSARTGSAAWAGTPSAPRVSAGDSSARGMSWTAGPSS